ncbi:MAG: SRPBCC family protein [Pseudomonadota bacterium]
MHLLAEQRVVIARPVPAVFEYATDLERFGEWFPEVLGVESADALAPAAVGKQYLERVNVPLRGERKVMITVREAQPATRFVTEGRLTPLLPRMELGFAAHGDQACEFTFRMFSRSGSPAVRWLLLPLARRVLRRRAAAGVAALKRRLEGR